MGFNDDLLGFLMGLVDVDSVELHKNHQSCWFIDSPKQIPTNID
jgi:hypothetical protein